MMLTPAASASRVPANRTGRPEIRSSPSYAGITPARIFIRVLFPAPFSPQTACSSPRAIDSDTSLSATTPGNRLVIERTSMCGRRVKGLESRGSHPPTVNTSINRKPSTTLDPGPWTLDPFVKCPSAQNHQPDPGNESAVSKLPVARRHGRHHARQHADDEHVEDSQDTWKKRLPQPACAAQLIDRHRQHHQHADHQPLEQVR